MDLETDTKIGTVTKILISFYFFDQNDLGLTIFFYFEKTMACQKLASSLADIENSSTKHRRTCQIVYLSRATSLAKC